MIGKVLSFVVLVVMMVLGILLGSLNPTSVPFDYYFDQRHIPLSILLSLSFISGLLLAGFFIILQVVHLKWTNHKLNKQIKKQSNEIIELKKKVHTEQEKSVTTELIVSPVKPD
ncbi:LapA family protein [Thiomicrospira microaerophila]|uniref:LapA family protein n=1 Tax=Thiomicrospira microaerophila TaxID=406020 RepID=UPI0005C84CC3|nr:LapA family protein [Thiomicrospira microaerophila]